MLFQTVLNFLPPKKNTTTTTKTFLGFFIPEPNFYNIRMCYKSEGNFFHVFKYH